MAIHAVYQAILLHVILSKPAMVNCMCMFVSGWGNVTTPYLRKLARLQMVLCGSVNQIPHWVSFEDFFFFFFYPGSICPYPIFLFTANKIACKSNVQWHKWQTAQLTLKWFNKCLILQLQMIACWIVYSYNAILFDKEIKPALCQFLCQS